MNNIVVKKSFKCTSKRTPKIWTKNWSDLYFSENDWKSSATKVAN